MSVRYALLIGALLMLPSCLPEVVDDDSVPNFNAENTIMGVIQEEGVLRIAVEDDRAPWSDFDGAEPVGFTVELGRLIARSLGVEAEFVPATPDEMTQMLDGEDIDVAFPLTPITEEKVSAHAYADPYWAGHQRLLVPEDSEIEQVDDLGGATVCSVVDAGTGAPALDLNPDIGDLIEPGEPLGCVEPMRSGEATAVVGPDVLLIAHMEALGDGYRIVGDQLTTEGYGPAVVVGLGGFTSFIDGVFSEADREGVWREYYDEWIAPLTGVQMEFPRMTTEDAAALYPAG
jgi:ABC-type amino acid transport substrate-binding protein